MEYLNGMKAVGIALFVGFSLPRIEYANSDWRHSDPDESAPLPQNEYGMSSRERNHAWQITMDRQHYGSESPKWDAISGHYMAMYLPPLRRSNAEFFTVDISNTQSTQWLQHMTSDYDGSQPNSQKRNF